MTGWLVGYTALITGGGSGIGAAVAQRYVEEGANVVILGRDKNRLDLVAASCADPSRMHAIEGDVRSATDLESAVAEAVRRFDKLDVLVPNAGVWDFQRQLTRLTGQELSEAFDELFAVNVKGYLLASHAAWPELVRTRGSIVMTLSNASFFVNGGGPVYTASKHACLGLMRELAYELAPKVRVNGVACGGMNTDLRGPSSLNLDERSIATSFAKKAEGSPRPPLPLWDSSTKPADFTASYVLLASREQAGPITGQAISVDGGMGVRGFRSDAGGNNL